MNKQRSSEKIHIVLKVNSEYWATENTTSFAVIVAIDHFTKFTIALHKQDHGKHYLLFRCLSRMKKRVYFNKYIILR